MDEYFMEWLKEHDKETYAQYLHHLMDTQQYYEFGVPVNYTEADGTVAPTFADIYTFEDFLELVKDGSFIDYDGTGYLAKKNADGVMMEYFDIFCDEDWLNRNHYDFTHICWYNK